MPICVDVDVDVDVDDGVLGMQRCLFVDSISCLRYANTDLTCSERDGFMPGYANTDLGTRNATVSECDGVTVVGCECV